MITEYISLATLFDLDGVILDTEKQYTQFWEDICTRYRLDSEIAGKLKGQTIEMIFKNYFANMEKARQEITTALDKFESEMEMQYIPGLPEFVHGLHVLNIKSAVVTSSSQKKMEKVYRKHPELTAMFDRILTAENFTRSKPAPDCYLLGAAVLNKNPQNCFVFEDSFNGLKSGRAAGMHVIGLATTNPADSIRELADIVISDFRGTAFETLVSRFY